MPLSVRRNGGSSNATQLAFALERRRSRSRLRVRGSGCSSGVRGGGQGVARDQAGARGRAVVAGAKQARAHGVAIAPRSQCSL